jgi:plastocyanin
MNRGRLVVVAVIVIVLVLAIAALALSMGGNKQNGPSPPQLRISSPAPGSSMAGPDIPVTVEVSNFSLVDKIGQVSVNGEGHLVYYLDVTAPTSPNVSALTAPGTYMRSVSTTNFWTNITPGLHTFSAQLVNNNDTSLNPAVFASVSMTVVPPPPPELRIIRPFEGSSVIGPDVAIFPRITNFNVVDKIGQASVSGEGHIVYYLDVSPPTTPNTSALSAAGTYADTVADSFNWTGLTNGAHTFSVQLVNNNDTPLVPAVTDTVNVVVIAPPAPVVVAISAHGLAFNTSSITVPAGASVTVNFNNQDAGVTHTFSVYADSTTTSSIFAGTPITGVSSTTYTFTAPSVPGTYYFQCDFHPSMMHGSFVVTG